MTVCFVIPSCSASSPLSAQLFSSEEKRASQHRVTVHGALGPEPFTVFCVTEQTTAKQLLDMVSDLEDEFMMLDLLMLQQKMVPCSFSHSSL